MNLKMTNLVIALLLISVNLVTAQEVIDSSLLTLDRIFSGEFSQDRHRTIQWIENGDAYVTIEKSTTLSNADELVRYNSTTQDRMLFAPAEALNGLSIESFSLSPDGSKILIFTNSSRVWRSNTKGDYWVYDLTTKTCKQLGTNHGASSLMFAKFSTDNRFVFYVHKFNIYKEDFQSGSTTQLTFDGTVDIINGTFDWVYEEEFGKRDGFTLSPNDEYLAFWQLDASDIGTYYMINNTDSVYSKPIPLQYPKVGQDPAAAKIGVLSLKTRKVIWIPLPGGEKENYIPGIQWVRSDLLLIQQMNRLQNQLTVWTYIPSTQKLSKVYVEKENTWIDIWYPDISSNNWGNNDLQIIDNRNAFLRMTENDSWRHIYRVDIATGDKKLITPFNFDVASMSVTTSKEIFFIASPNNSTQRYLYSSDLKAESKAKRITPEMYSGTNFYDIAPNGKYAIHNHQSAQEVETVRFISLPDHQTIKILVDNKPYKEKIESLQLPEVKFTNVTTEEGIEIDVRMVLPISFDTSKKYPVLFHVYGEPWSQEATDTQVNIWYIMMAQMGYVIIDMDNRGTPCLKGSAWRKCIYRKVGVINTMDQAMAAKEILKLDYLDNDRTAVWGHSGGGSMTLNLLFKYPEIYKTGIAMAALSNLLIYDNIYMERYMGLPAENKEDFINGSPVTYAKNLVGNLLLIHGTGDDNVHYQSAELLINELIKQNKQFQFMPYPNRSHGIWEGENTSRHLLTLITNFILEHTPPN